MNTLIYGLQYGDEGKGRVSAFFSKDYDWSIRFNGGPNAGHTVWHENKKYKLNHLPAGAVTGKKVALDAGMVIDVKKLYNEWQILPNKPKLYISERTHVITEGHLKDDAHGSDIGSTKRGIAYVYRDKVLRKGRRIIEELQDTKSPLHLMNISTYDALPPVENAESAIYESAQGVMLDVDYGCYPFVTSSTVFPTVIHNISKKIGVLKAYTSRVGDGPPNYPDVPQLRELGQEYGTTTGRPRKCTWLVLDEIRYALKISRPNEIVVTKLDILKDVDIKVWDNGKCINIGNLDNYKEFLFTNIPNIKYLSEAPDGDLIQVDG
jgi:adenylosuccinate synthase